ncbi:MAG: InlB B-repeat-containing protein [Bacteroidia bacterium]|nr:InlB B-repeat-containing protein [Bacteroidia bacterium]
MKSIKFIAGILLVVFSAFFLITCSSGGGDGGNGSGGGTNAKYKVTYKANTGSGSVPTDSNRYQTGATVTVLGSGTLTKNGYAFTGWNTKENGSGTTYAPGLTVTIDKANVTLYAMWTVVSSTAGIMDVSKWDNDTWGP